MSQPPVDPEQPPSGEEQPGNYPPPPGQYPPPPVPSPPAAPPTAPMPSAPSWSSPTAEPPSPWSSPTAEPQPPTTPMPPVPPPVPPYAAPPVPPYAAPPVPPYAAPMPPVPSAPPYAPMPPAPPVPSAPPYATQAYPTYAGQPPYPGQPFPPGAASASKSNRTALIIVFVVVGALILLCCAVGVGVVALNRANSTTQNETPVDLPSFGNPTAPGTRTSSSGGDGANSNLAIGKTASFSDSDGSWTVTLISRAWRDTNCGTNSIFPPPDGKLLVVEIAFEVKSGRASINPLYFDYVDSAGKTGNWSLLSGCDKPDLVADNDLPSGTKRTGKIAFEVSGSQNGQLTYDPIFSDSTASWKITP